MNAIVAFPDYPAADLPPIPEGFVDCSWHNDACPSYQSEALRLHVFVDYEDVALRESVGFSDRFVVYPLDEDGCLGTDPALVETNNWDEVLAFIETRRVRDV